MGWSHINMLRPMNQLSSLPQMKAMSEHVKIFHFGGPPVFDLGKSVILKEPMYCVCGYSAHSGMKLAKHIGRSGCQTAYPTIPEANKAKVERDGSGGGSAGG